MANEKETTRKAYTRSLGTEKKVCGHLIKKMPIGAFMKAICKLQDIPGDLAEQCFPGRSFMEILDDIQAKQFNALRLVAGGLLRSVPDFFIEVCADLLDIPRETLENDENIGPDGLIEMLEVWYDINKIGNFSRRVGRIWGTAKALTQVQTTRGLNGSSPSQSSSESEKATS